MVGDWMDTEDESKIISLAWITGRYQHQEERTNQLWWEIDAVQTY